MSPVCFKKDRHPIHLFQKLYQGTPFGHRELPRSRLLQRIHHWVQHKQGRWIQHQQVLKRKTSNNASKTNTNLSVRAMFCLKAKLLETFCTITGK